MMRSSAIVWVLGALLILSMGFNYYMGKDYVDLVENDWKYRFIYHTGNQKFLHELDSIWRIDSLREKRKRLVQDLEAQIMTDRERENKVQELRRELDSLESKTE